MGEEPSAPEGGAPELAPESFNTDDLNMLLEEHLFGQNDFMNLGKGRNSLVEIDGKLKDLLEG
jgi:hypothetical protein